MIRRLAKFWQLPWPDRLRFLEAWLMLGIARGAVRLLSFRRALRLLKGGGGQGTDPQSSPRQPLLDQVGRAVPLAARFTPWSSNCLAQALAASAMLRLRGVSSELHLGVAKPGEALEAHAWLCSGGRFISGEPGHQRYAIVSTF